MTKTLTMNKVETGNYENSPQYLEYVKLLRQYYEIKNDEEKLQNKFNEIINQHQKLVQSGIIVI
jgi:penicillin V acylase-like amidase (Ntn superfamily)